VIEVYSQTSEGVTFAVALDNGKILVTTFRVDSQEALECILDNLPFGEPFEVCREVSAEAKVVLDAVKAIYDGKDTDATLTISTQRLPAYTNRVIQATIAIPVGYVTTYGAIASAVGGGARAVGNAMACNLFAPVVPCHRVVKSDFTLGGYGAGGLKVKLEFLRREKRGYTEPKTVEVCGGQLQVFPVESVLEKVRL
jgi:methylated-DNA-[protein]-cysteine S-methyltransferase